MEKGYARKRYRGCSGWAAVLILTAVAAGLLVFAACDSPAADPPGGGANQGGSGKVPQGPAVRIAGTVTVTVNSGYEQAEISVRAYRGEGRTDEELLETASAALETGAWSMEIPKDTGTAWFSVFVRDETNFRFSKAAGSEEIPTVGKTGIKLAIGGFAPPRLNTFSLPELNKSGTINQETGVITFSPTTVGGWYGQGISENTWLEVDTFKAAFTADGQAVVNGAVQVSGQTPNNFLQPVTYTVIAEDNTRKTYTVTPPPVTGWQFTGGIPVMKLDTKNGMTLAQLNQTNKEIWMEGGEYALYDKGELIASGPTDVKGHGNYSWRRDSKKSYSLKLGSKTGFFGLPAHRRWTLLAHPDDPSLLRNAAAFELGRIFDRMGWQPHLRHVMLYLNGSFLGVYQLTEAIKVDPGRVDVNAVKTGNPSGGYLLEINNTWDDEEFHYETAHKNQVLNRSGYYKGEGGYLGERNYTEGIIFSFSDPDSGLDAVIGGDVQTLLQKMSGALQDADDAVYSAEYAEADNGYRQYLDVDSFADWYICQVFTSNWEMISLNGQYMYFDPEKAKYRMGPLWDFDKAWNYGSSSSQGSPVTIQGAPFWTKSMMSDSYFRGLVKARWNEKKDEISRVLTAEAAGFLDIKKAELNSAFQYAKSNSAGSFQVDQLKTHINSKIISVNAYMNGL